MSLSRAETRDKNWRLQGDTGADSTVVIDTTEDIIAAILMDIREELRTLNALCLNLQQMPHTIGRIDRRLANRLPMRAKRKAEK